MRELLLCSLVIVGAACSEKTADKEQRAPATSKSETAGSADIEAEQRVRDVFNRWLGAQNAGDFDSYSRLYSSDFAGVKRSGKRTFQFDRDGWLEDRKRMFQKKMLVEADDIELEVKGARATVLFRQTWEQGTYKDVGPKRLALANQTNNWLITREEMLDSKLVAPDVVRNLETIADELCGCSQEACANRGWQRYDAWVETLRSEPAAIRSLTKAYKLRVHSAAGRAYDCASRVLDGMGDVALPPSPEHCPKWFDRPDKWYCVAECDEYCAGRF